jgi:hypothetical protein
VAPRRRVVLDDRLLIDELLSGRTRRRSGLHTTSYWYYRACRAAVLGAGGHLSGPFEEVGPPHQERAIASLLELPDDIALPDPRPVVPTMVEIAGRHPRLNLLNLEAVAVGRLLPASLWLSAETAAGVLPAALDAEGVTWETVAVS